jgi:hypothetical protein
MGADALRREHQRHRAARADRLRQVAAVQHHSRARLEIGGHRAEGNGQAIEFAPGQEIPAQEDGRQ